MANEYKLSFTAEEIEEKLKAVEPISTKTNALEKRVTNLEQGIIFLPFKTDSTVAYQKVVPTNALSYAEVEKVGGMTRKCTNEIPFPYYHTSKTINGITWTVNADGSVTANGTATSLSSFEVAKDSKTEGLSLNAGTYTLSGCPAGGSFAKYYMRLIANDTLNEGGDDFGSGKTLTINSSTPSIGIVLRVSSGVTVSNLTFKPMLNEGSNALPYEPYYKGLRSAPVTEVESVDRNLFDDSTLLNLGFTKVAEHEYFHNNIWNVEKTPIFVNTTRVGGSFTISAKVLYKDVGSTSNGLYLEVYYTDGTNQKHPATNAVQGEYFEYITTTNASKTVDYINFSYGSSAVDTTIKNMQIEYGNTATEYSPYTKTSLPIPEAVQALDGYGWGVNDTCYNYIDWENKLFVKRVGAVDLGTLSWYETSFDDEGNFNAFVADVEDMALPITAEDRKTGFICEMYSPSESVDEDNLSDKSIIRHENGAFYIRDNSYSSSFEFAVAMHGVMLYYEIAELILADKPTITDISNLITDDNFISIEGGGVLTFKNEYGYAVPSEITYQLRGVAE